MKRAPFIIFVLFWSCLAMGQDERSPLIELGAGYNFKQEERGYSFSFVFNKTPATDKQPGSYFAYFKNFLWSKYAVLKPWADCNIGKDVETSPNNVFFAIGLETHKKIGRVLDLNTEFAPSISADKDFKSGLIYLKLGSKLLYYYKRTNTHIQARPGLGLDVGSSVSDTTTPDMFFRAVPSFSVIFGTLPDTSEKDRLKLIVDGKFYMVAEDKIVKDGVYGNLDLALNYILNQNFSLALNYIMGFEQPSFKRMNALTFGLTIYQ